MGGPKKTENATKKLLIGSGCTLAFEAAMGHPCEFIKVAKQTQPQHSYAAIVRGIVGQKGIVGIWDGFLPWGAVQAVFKGGVFAFAHAGTRTALQGLVNKGTISDKVSEVAAGGIGGGFQGLVLSPTLLLKTRVMTDPVFRNNMTMGETVTRSAAIGMKVIKDEGVSALMKGSIVFSGKRVADWSTRFIFSIAAEDMVFRKGDAPLATHEKIAASLVGGTLSTMATIPIDVMVAQIQQSSNAGQQVSVFESFAAEYRAGGMNQILGFATRGFVARVTHVALTTALMKTATSWVYDKLQD